MGEMLPTLHLPWIFPVAPESRAAGKMGFSSRHCHNSILSSQKAWQKWSPSWAQHCTVICNSVSSHSCEIWAATGFDFLWFGFFGRSFEGRVWPELTGSYLWWWLWLIGKFLHFATPCLSMSCCFRSCWNGCYMIYIPYSLSKMKNKKKHNSECFWAQRFQQRDRRLAPNRAKNGRCPRNRKLLYFAFVIISRFRDLEFSLAS